MSMGYIKFLSIQTKRGVALEIDHFNKVRLFIKKSDTIVLFCGIFPQAGNII